MAAAAPKPAFSFGFSKKAEPKRKVEALAAEKPKEDRVAITSLAEGKVEVDGAVEEAKKLSIPCKNPLQETAAKKTMTAEEKASGEAKKKELKDKNLDDLPGGLVNRNLSNLSSADAAAAKELLKDAQNLANGIEEAPTEVKPILMQEGSKKARHGTAPDASKDMFDKVPVESFGEALLRGMGYNPEEKDNTKFVYYDKPRDNLLGLGAKALSPSEKLAAAKRKASGEAKAAEKAAVAEAEKRKAGGGASSSTATATAAGDGNAAKASEVNRERSRSRDGADTDAKRRKVDMWPSRGLIVRVTKKDGQLTDFFGVDMVVLKVDESTATVSIKGRPASDPEGKSQQLQGVNVADIETRVSRDTEKVRIVRGPREGTVAKILKRDAKRCIAVLSIEGAETEMPLNDVCQFMG